MRGFGTFHCLKCHPEFPAALLAGHHPFYGAPSVLRRRLLGQPPTDEWASIRNTFWNADNSEQGPFMLGDFAKLARFVALTQAEKLVPPSDGVGGKATQADVLEATDGGPAISMGGEAAYAQS